MFLTQTTQNPTLLRSSDILKKIPNWLVSPPRHHKMECETSCEGPKNVLMLIFSILFSLDRVKGQLSTV